MLDLILEAYDWFDHPDGPKFVETHRDAHRTCGHWLFLPGSFAAFHRVLDSDELWLVHAGRVTVHVIEPDGAHRELHLGLDLSAGERPVATVGAGFWQAAELPPDTPYAFGANVCAPPFSFEEFEIADPARLATSFPDHRPLIGRLTRDS